MPRNNSKQRREQRKQSAAERLEKWNSMTDAQRMEQRDRNSKAASYNKVLQYVKHY